MNDILGQKRLCIFLDEYYQFLLEMEDTQQKKIKALAVNSLDEIQKTIVAQQAEIMNLANMEEKRLRLQSEIGMDDYTFKQIIDAADTSLKGKLTELFAKIETCLEQIKFLNTKANTFIKGKMVEYDADSEGYGYTKVGTHTGGQTPAFLQTKI